MTDPTPQEDAVTPDGAVSSENAVSSDNAASPPEPPSSEGQSEEAVPGGRRTPLARRLEDPQRVDGGGRWSVESTRRRCCRCDQALPDHDTFHTVLEPAPAEDFGGDEDEREVFVRNDYCEGCFVAQPPETVFAHWRRILPPPPTGPRKIVNLASLLAHWHQLV